MIGPQFSLAEAAREIGEKTETIKTRFKRHYRDQLASDGHAEMVNGEWKVDATGVAALRSIGRNAPSVAPTDESGANHSPTDGTQLTTADVELGFTRGELADKTAALHTAEMAALKAENDRLRSEIEQVRGERNEAASALIKMLSRWTSDDPTDPRPQP